MMFKLKSFSPSSTRCQGCGFYSRYPGPPIQETLPTTQRKLTGWPGGQLQGPEAPEEQRYEDTDRVQPTMPCTWPPDGTSVLPSVCKDSLREKRERKQAVQTQPGVCTRPPCIHRAWCLHAPPCIHRAWCLHAASLYTQSLVSAHGLPVYTEPGVCTQPPCTHRASHPPTCCLVLLQKPHDAHKYENVSSKPLMRLACPPCSRCPPSLRTD